MNTESIVIIGKYGKTGARVEQRLKQQGILVRGVSRSTQPAFDWKVKSGWREAIEGARALYVTYQPDLAVPQAEEDIRHLIHIAKSVGVEHIVLLSGRGEEGAERAEQLVIKSGLEWNIVRANWFAQNFSESFMLEGIKSGNLALPADLVKEPFVDADDIADVVVAALTQCELHNQLFEVSGPEALTFADCIGTIAKACGKTIDYTPITINDFLHELDIQGIDNDFQWLMKELFGNVLDGRNSSPTEGIEQALGRKPTSFEKFVEKTVVSGIWS